MTTYKLKKSEKLLLDCSQPLSGMYKLSPFVWKEKSLFKMLIRAVNTSEDSTQKTARIYYGESADGLHFKMDDGPVIAPGTGIDKDGCEDPTVCRAKGTYNVYYTGWDQTKLEGQLLLARGKNIRKLNIAGVAIPSHKPYTNPKEATLAQMKNGQWTLFFEYADENRSKLGKATSADPNGPWKIQGEFLEAVKDSWDSYHLSPGPVVENHLSETVMFYNGADPKARWRIGWAELDPFGKIIRRSGEPLITPPKQKKGETNIAFAASAILMEEEIWLYYTTADKTTYRSVIAVIK